MTILSVVRDVCVNVGVLYPTTVFTGITSNRTMQEMAALANEMAQRTAYDTREWTKLKKQATYTGDGVTTAFTVPADYKRMLLTANVYKSTNPDQPMRFIADTNEWMQRRAKGITDSYGEWTMLGDNLHIFPVLRGPVINAPNPDTPAEYAWHGYLHKNCVNLNSGGKGEAFVNDADSYALDERLLKLSMIWQWKASKGGAYAEDLGTFTDALATSMGADKPSPIYISRSPISSNANIAYQGPTPDAMATPWPP